MLQGLLTFGQSTLDTSYNSGQAAANPLVSLIWLAFAVVLIVAMWKVFTKAGKPGWAAIVPFYNVWVLAEIAGKPGWWGLLLYVPFVNIVISILLSIELAHKFGKSTGFGIVALWLFSVVGLLILGFGQDTYNGAAATVAASTPSATPPAAPTATPPSTPLV